MQNLSLARDCALAFMKLDIKAEYTSLLLRGQEYGDFLNAADVNDADEVLEIMEKDGENKFNPEIFWILKIWSPSGNMFSGPRPRRFL